MSSLNATPDSVLSAINSAIKLPLPETILGISFGYAVDGGDYDYIRVTIHSTNVFDPRTSEVEDDIENSLKKSFSSIPIFHMDTMLYTCEDIRNSSAEVLWAYKANCD